ncbi:MAG: energy transducer TonB [Sphingomonadaceae bacterium]|nr:energy transducer TonB [Sphingomonadaceae bacterium]
MKTLTIPALALATLAPSMLLAQSPDDAAVEEALEATEAAAEAVGDAEPREQTRIAPAPPALEIRTARSVKRGPRDPEPINYRSLQVPHAAYPLEAWRAGEEGSVGYEIKVDKIGRAKSCAIVQTSGSDLLDQATCPALMKEAVFRPALDKEGEAVSGIYRGTLRWEKKEPDVPAVSAVFSYRHGADGITSDCAFEKLEGELPERIRRDIERDMARGDGCPGKTGRGPGIPYRDSEGNPVSKIVTIRVQIEVEDAVE